jgi:hypothetical protein
VNHEARRALAVIQKCVKAERFALSLHFSERMKQRGLFWADVRTVIDDPRDVASRGLDSYDRPKWIIDGEAAYGEKIEIICAIELDETETEFITIYWE